MKRPRTWIAVALFTVLFTVSQDYWTWAHPTKFAPLGLPRWVYTFAMLQVGVSAVVWWYVRRESNRRESETDDAT